MLCVIRVYQICVMFICASIIFLCMSLVGASTEYDNILSFKWGTTKDEFGEMAFGLQGVAIESIEEVVLYEGKALGNNDMIISVMT